jgi:hypothetical protein
MRNTGTVLDVNPDMNIEMKLTSPIFSETGSQTISDSLPATVKNNRELSFPGKKDSSEKTKTLFPIILDSDSFQQAGELHVLGVSDGAVSFNIGTDESTMYAAIKTKIISELEDMPVYEPDIGSEHPLVDIISYLQQTRDDPEAPVTVFPVVVEDKESNGAHHLTILNKSINVSNYYTGIQWEARKIPQIIDSTVANIDVPDGYGVAPFVKVWKVLEIIFRNFEFQIVENVFKSHPQLKLLTCLHNCVDSICFGKIDYRKIVPEETVENFLNALHNKFGAVVFVNSTNRSIKIKLLKDIFASAEYRDITAFKSGELTWKHTEQKQIRLKMKTGLDTAKPPVESYNEFVTARKGSIPKVVNYEGAPADPSVVKYKTLYSVSSGMYYRQIEIAANNIKRELLGTDFFDWDQKTKDMEYQEYSAIDESVPLMYLVGEYPAYLPRYITGISHKNTMLVNIQESKDEKKAPLAFLFYFGRPQEGINDLKNHFYVASSFCESFTGTPLQGEEYSISLTARSLYSNFWKEFDAVLRHSNQEYEGDFDLPKSACAKFDFSSKLLVDNQQYLPFELDFAFVGSTPKLILRSLKLRKPYDMDQDEYFPPLGQKIFEWVFYEGLRDAANAYINYLYLNSSDDRDSFKIDSIYRDRDQVPEDISETDPPTENDYNEQKKIFVKEYTGTLIYAHLDVSSRSNTYEVLHTVTITYQCYYHPELV